MATNTFLLMTVAPTTKRVIIYCGQAVVTTMAAGLTVEMLGGKLSWPELIFRWIVLLLSILGSVFNILRAYYDQTTGKESPSPSDPPLKVEATIT